MEINYDHEARVMHVTQQQYIKATAEMFKQTNTHKTETYATQV